MSDVVGFAQAAVGESLRDVAPVGSSTVASVTFYVGNAFDIIQGRKWVMWRNNLKIVIIRHEIAHSTYHHDNAYLLIYPLYCSLTFSRYNRIICSAVLNSEQVELLIQVKSFSVFCGKTDPSHSVPVLVT